MYKKSDAELERFIITKATRTIVRLKHSLAADRELNEILPARLEEFDAAVQRGELLTMPLRLEQD